MTDKQPPRCSGCGLVYEVGGDFFIDDRGLLCSLCMEYALLVSSVHPRAAS